MAKTWKQRLVKESKKLDKKLCELTSFIEGEHGEFDKLREVKRDLLITQHSAMTTYSNILEMRMRVEGLTDVEECDECDEARDELKKAFKNLFENMHVEMDKVKDEDGRNS